MRQHCSFSKLVEEVAFCLPLSTQPENRNSTREQHQRLPYLNVLMFWCAVLSSVARLVASGVASFRLEQSGKVNKLQDSQAPALVNAKI